MNKKIIKKDGREYSVRSNRDRFFFPKEYMKFHDALRNSQRLTFDMLINTGTRINEARHIKVGDIDLENKRLIVRVTKVKASKGEKNPRPRTIPISTQFCKRLKKYIVDNKLNNDSTLSLLSTPAANIGMKKALKAAKIEDWYMFSVHNIRKTLENWLLALGVDAVKISKHMGHNITTAIQHYVSADVFSFEEKQQIRLIIGDLYGR